MARDLDYQQRGRERRPSTFETYRGGKNIGVDLKLKSKYGNQEQQNQAREQLAKNKTYGTSANQSVFEKMGTKTRNYNINQRNKYIQRILKARMDKLNAGLKESGVDFYGDTDEDYQDFINNYAKSITAYGPEGTGLYSQKMIDDVLSKNRVPPEFFTKIDPSGGMLGSGAAALANFLGPKMAGPVTQERLNELYKEYQGIQNIDPNTMSVKQMMEIYEPNRYKTIYGDGQPDGDADYLNMPINYNTGAALPVDETAEDKTFDYRFGNNQNVGADVTRASYIFNQGGRVPRNMGGIMNAVPRQGYFLGKIVDTVTKPFKGIAKAAGKVLKSDFGKAALAGAAFMYGPKLFGATKLGGLGGYTQLIPKMADNKFLSSMLLNKDKDSFNPFKIAGLFGLGASAFMPTKVDQLPDSGTRGGKLKDSQGNEVLPSEIRDEINEAYASGDAGRIKEIENYYAFLPPINQYLPYPNYATGGRVAAQEGGLMNLGGMEKDYRNTGGFVDIGAQEKADDVPARLSVNEFVMTADAVRNAGGGDIDKGAEVMENMMKNLENGGRISEESQGNTGAKEMFSVSERIGEVI